ECRQNVGQTLALALRNCHPVAHQQSAVQSVYPDWSFSTTDAVINQGMHGRLLVGDRVAIAQGQRKGLADILSTLEIELTCNGQHIAYGSGHAVLGGPVHAVAHLSAIAGADTLRAGETITTGTLTPVLAVQPGDSWAIVARTNPLGLNAPTVKLEAEA
ncbi:MAG: fumarylacetoacetate hydrolase family protein, partial [Pseudomonadota bacterium]